MDVGSSTGMLIKDFLRDILIRTLISELIQSKKCAKLQNKRIQIRHNIDFECIDFLILNLKNLYQCLFLTTMQFINSSIRQKFIDKILILWNGWAFFIREKRSPDARSRLYDTSL